jgi:SigmaK-factor processing regulatory protein BofA
MVYLVELGSLLVAVFILYLLYSFLKSPLHLIANAIMGIIIFLIINFFLVGGDIAINFFSVGTVAIAGIPGVLLVLLIHFLGLGF